LPALGDLRQCLAALASETSPWSGLLQHRFAGARDLDGHALGNLVLLAAVERHGGVVAALDALGRSLGVRGRVLPATEQPVVLEAELADGRSVRGESAIRAAGGRIRALALAPADAPPAPGVLEAIADADVLVLGPGSLFTSVLPNLLTDGVAAAVRRARAARIYVCNLMTEHGETDAFDLDAHLATVERVLGPGSVDACLVNDAALAPETLERFASSGAQPVRWSAGRRRAPHRPLTVHADLLPPGGFDGRHQPDKLACAVLALAECLRRERWTPLPIARPRVARLFASPYQEIP
jgi:uncharacterized cofD-like protein